MRRRSLSLEAIQKSLNTPAERHHTDTEHLRCPKCKKEFVPKGAQTQFGLAGTPKANGRAAGETTDADVVIGPFTLGEGRGNLFCRANS